MITTEYGFLSPFIMFFGRPCSISVLHLCHPNVFEKRPIYFDLSIVFPDHDCFCSISLFARFPQYIMQFEIIPCTVRVCIHHHNHHHHHC